jgi:uncharacterized protein YjbJ (UPF0337 family)
VIAVVDEVKERFTREWDSLKAMARVAFAKLSEEDLESVKGHFDELRHRVVQAYGYAEERAHEEVSKLLHRDGSGEARPMPPSSAEAKPAHVKYVDEKHPRKKPRGAKRHARAQQSPKQ